MRSGRLRHELEIRRPDRTVNEYGEPSVREWTLFLRTRAAILPVSASEQEKFAKLQGELTHSVVMRYRPGIQPDMRIVWPAENRTFEIIEIKQAPTFRRDLVLKVSELVEVK